MNWCQIYINIHTLKRIVSFIFENSRSSLQKYVGVKIWKVAQWATLKNWVARRFQHTVKQFPAISARSHETNSLSWVTTRFIEDTNAIFSILEWHSITYVQRVEFSRKDQSPYRHQTPLRVLLSFLPFSPQQQEQRLHQRQLHRQREQSQLLIQRWRWGPWCYNSPSTWQKDRARRVRPQPWRPSKWFGFFRPGKQGKS